MLTHPPGFRQQDQDPCYGPHYNARHPAFHEPLEFSGLLENPQPMHPTVVDVHTTNGVLQHLAWLGQSLLANSFFICQIVFQLKISVLHLPCKGLTSCRVACPNPHVPCPLAFCCNPFCICTGFHVRLLHHLSLECFRSSSQCRVGPSARLRARVPQQVMIHVATFRTRD